MLLRVGDQVVCNTACLGNRFTDKLFPVPGMSCAALTMDHSIHKKVLDSVRTCLPQKTITQKKEIIHVAMDRDCGHLSVIVCWGNETFLFFELLSSLQYAEISDKNECSPHESSTRIPEDQWSNVYRSSATWIIVKILWLLFESLHLRTACRLGSGLNWVALFTWCTKIEVKWINFPLNFLPRIFCSEISKLCADLKLSVGLRPTI